MKKLAFVAGAAAVATGALLVGGSSHAADHLDAPATVGNHMADINDVYAWMNSDASKVNLVMTVSPADDTTRHFGPSVQYVFHVTEYAGTDNSDAYTNAQMHMGTEHKVICTFASDTSAQCWIVTGSHVDDYIKGDPSATAGITSSDGKIKLFAGQRGDPFFFNLSGFHNALAAVGQAAATPGFATDAAGCPTATSVTVAQAAGVRGLLSATPTAATTVAPCPAGVKDCFASFNVKAIVLQIDKTLLVGTGHHLVSVWGSTHMGS